MNTQPEVMDALERAVKRRRVEETPTAPNTDYQGIIQLELGKLRSEIDFFNQKIHQIQTKVHYLEGLLEREQYGDTSNQPSFTLLQRLRTLPRHLIMCIMEFVSFPFPRYVYKFIHTDDDDEEENAPVTAENHLLKNSTNFLCKLFFGYFYLDSTRTIYQIFPNINMQVLGGNYLTSHGEELAMNGPKMATVLDYVACYRVKRLNLCGFNIKQCDRLYRFHSLLSLNLEACHYTVQEIRGLLKHMTHLHSLNISMPKKREGIFGPDDVSCFAPQSAPYLTNLKLESHQIQSSGLEYLLENCTQIIKLNVAENLITETGLIKLPQNRSIKSLNLNENQIKDAGVYFILQNTSLRDIELTNCGITDDSARQLFCCQNLVRLDISSNAITSDSIKFIEHNTTLTDLSAFGLSLDNTSAECIGHNQSLHELRFGETERVDDSVFVTFFKDHTSCRNITELVVFECRLSDAAVECIVKNNQSLTYIDLSENRNISSEGAKMLAQHPSLVRLILQDNNIRNEGAQYLLMNTNLVELDLMKNSINDAGIEYIRFNHTLKELKLTDNYITSHGAKILFSENNTLSVLELGNCHITDEAIHSLKDNTSLTRLLLNGNSGISNDSKRWIVHNCSNLQYLYLTDDPCEYVYM